VTVTDQQVRVWYGTDITNLRRQSAGGHLIACCFNRDRLALAPPRPFPEYRDSRLRPVGALFQPAPSVGFAARAATCRAAAGQLLVAGSGYNSGASRLSFRGPWRRTLASAFA
jgi:hypothetical protein